MQLYRDLQHLPASQRGVVLALGNFDGVHLGHRHLLKQARELADSLGAPLAVMSFEPHPRRVFNPSLPPLRIVPLAEKLALLKQSGVETLLIQRFTMAFSQFSAQEFVQRMLQDALQIKGLVTGEDFMFGHQRKGNARFLQEQAASEGFHYQAIAPFLVAGEVCSSSRIRAALQQGDMAMAAQLLGRPYHIIGRVIHGDKRGREWGFPTANLRPFGMFLPAFGVYSAILHDKTTGQHYPAVANLGIRPMFALEKPLLETHLLNASPDIYGHRIAVELRQFLRPEARFESEAALRTQIAKDCEMARASTNEAR
jgi:riboflavin kinase/FMN adenylyltransferase